jgi:uncharacterized protein YegL
MKDATGVEIEVGDRILYAALEGRSACLHRGVVTGFKAHAHNYQSEQKIQVTIEGYNKKPKIVYLLYPESIVVTQKGEKAVKNGLSEIVLVLDRSGSMESTKGDAEGGLREFIAKQRLIPGECRLTFYRFDDALDLVIEDKPLQLVEDRELALEPRGMTALVDAINRAIDEVGERLARRADYDRPEHVYVVIITDGQENYSNTPWATVKEKITRQTNQYKWQFIFIGSNQDAIATAARIGIGAQYSLNYAANRVGTVNSYQALSDNIGKSRIGGQAVQCFTDVQRSASMGDAQADAYVDAVIAGSTPNEALKQALGKGQKKAK